MEFPPKDEVKDQEEKSALPEREPEKFKFPKLENPPNFPLGEDFLKQKFIFRDAIISANCLSQLFFQ